MIQYPNSYYPNYYQPQQIPRQQMFQPQMAIPTGMSGRFVNDQNEITANDVPMDGKYAVFPKNDMTEIYAKMWDASGQIRTIRFKADNSIANTQKSEFEPSGAFTEVSERLSRIEELLKGVNRNESKPNDKHDVKQFGGNAKSNF